VARGRYGPHPTAKREAPAVSGTQMAKLLVFLFGAIALFMIARGLGL
jgi:hypothetical protein